MMWGGYIWARTSNAQGDRRTPNTRHLTWIDKENRKKGSGNRSSKRGLEGEITRGGEKSCLDLGEINHDNVAAEVGVHGKVYSWN